MTISDYNSRYIMLITVVVTLGGLLFGYDTAVIAGAISPLSKFFHLSPTQKGFAAASALLGCVIGSVISGFSNHIYGRRKTLQISAILFLLSAIGTALAPSYFMLVFFRILCGVGVGVASMASPMYIAEIAPGHIRGKLVACNQFSLVFGMLLVYFVNYIIALSGDGHWLIERGWRYMFASGIIPASLFLFLLFFIPRSPRWLAMVGEDAQAEEVLGKFSPKDKIAPMMREIKESLHHVGVKIFKSGYGKVLIFGILLSVFQQITGINVFLYYAPIIFKHLSSVSNNIAMLQTVFVGAVNLLFTIIAMMTVDHFGRKPLMMFGTFGMTVCIIVIGTAAFHHQIASWLLFFVLGYIAFFALSQGPVVWVLLSEIFPNKIRSKALAIAVASQWIANFVVSQTFPMMNSPHGALFLKFNGAFPFWLYGAMGIVSILFVYFFLPETKGLSLEALENVWHK